MQKATFQGAKGHPSDFFRGCKSSVFSHFSMLFMLIKDKYHGFSCSARFVGGMKKPAFLPWKHLVAPVSEKNPASRKNGI